MRTPTRTHTQEIITWPRGRMRKTNRERNVFFIIIILLLLNCVQCTYVSVVQSAGPDAGQQEEPRYSAAGQQFPTTSTAAQSAGAHQYRFQPEKGNIIYTTCAIYL